MQQVPPLGQHLPVLGQQQRAAQAGVMQAVQGLSLGIYSRLATQYIAAHGFEHIAYDPKQLKDIAHVSQAAARAYFEGLGIASFSKGDPNHEQPT
jgi:hypothetical protein